MFVYSGVLTAVTWVIPLFLGLTIALLQLSEVNYAVAERNARTQSYLVESLTGVQTIKLKMQRIMFVGSGSSVILVMSETFKTLMIGVSAGTVGSFLSQSFGPSPFLQLILLFKDNHNQPINSFRIISGYVVGPF